MLVRTQTGDSSVEWKGREDDGKGGMRIRNRCFYMPPRMSIRGSFRPSVYPSVCPSVCPSVDIQEKTPKRVISACDFFLLTFCKRDDRTTAKKIVVEAFDVITPHIMCVSLAEAEVFDVCCAL